MLLPVFQHTEKARTRLNRSKTTATGSRPMDGAENTYKLHRFGGDLKGVEEYIIIVTNRGLGVWRNRYIIELSEGQQMRHGAAVRKEMRRTVALNSTTVPQACLARKRKSNDDNM